MISREIGTHSRARDGCHMSTFSGRGMTNEEYEPISFDFPNEDLMAVLQIDEEKFPKENGWKCTLLEHRMP